MQIIPDASLAGLEITNQAAAGLRDVGDKIQNWKHMKRLDMLAAAREHFDMTSQIGNEIGQVQSVNDIGGILGHNQKQMNGILSQNPQSSPWRRPGLNNMNPEYLLAKQQGLLSPDEIRQEENIQFTGSHSDRQRQILEHGKRLFDMARTPNEKYTRQMETNKLLSDNDQRFRYKTDLNGGVDWMKSFGGGGKKQKLDQMYGYDTEARTWVPISMSRDIYENEKKRNAHLAKNYPSVDPNKLQYGGEDAGSKLVAKNDIAKAEYVKAMDNAGAFIESITGIGSDIKRHMPFTDTLTDQINNWNMKNSAGPIRIVQNEDGQIVTVPNNSYVFNDYLDVDKKGLVVSNEWKKNKSQVAKSQADIELEKAMGQTKRTANKSKRKDDGPMW